MGFVKFLTLFIVVLGIASDALARCKNKMKIRCHMEHSRDYKGKLRGFRYLSRRSASFRLKYRYDYKNHRIVERRRSRSSLASNSLGTSYAKRRTRKRKHRNKRSRKPSNEISTRRCKNKQSPRCYMRHSQDYEGKRRGFDHLSRKHSWFYQKYYYDDDTNRILRRKKRLSKSDWKRFKDEANTSHNITTVKGTEEVSNSQSSITNEGDNLDIVEEKNKSSEEPASKDKVEAPQKQSTNTASPTSVSRIKASPTTSSSPPTGDNKDEYYNSNEFQNINNETADISSRSSSTEKLEDKSSSNSGNTEVAGSQAQSTSSTSPSARSTNDSRAAVTPKATAPKRRKRPRKGQQVSSPSTASSPVSQARRDDEKIPPPAASIPTKKTNVDNVDAPTRSNNKTSSSPPSGNDEYYNEDDFKDIATQTDEPQTDIAENEAVSDSPPAPARKPKMAKAPTETEEEPDTDIPSNTSLSCTLANQAETTPSVGHSSTSCKGLHCDLVIDKRGRPAAYSLNKRSKKSHLKKYGNSIFKNVREVIPGLFYRFGAGRNKAKARYRHNAWGMNRNPILEQRSDAKHLCKLGYTHVFRANGNVPRDKREFKCPDGRKIKYLRVVVTSSPKAAMRSVQKNVLPVFYDCLRKKKKNPNTKCKMAVHCTDGMHRAGAVSAMLLRQICGDSGNEAFQYWSDRQVGWGGNYKEHRRKYSARINNYKPSPIPPDLKSEVAELKRSYCKNRTPRKTGKIACNQKDSVSTTVRKPATKRGRQQAGNDT